MKCPVCDSESYEILKTKGKNTREVLIKCNECGNTFKETVIIPKMVECRVIISKFEESVKKTIKIYPDEVLEVGEVLVVDGEEVEITSLENNRGGRVLKSPVSELVTVWAASLAGPTRVGISIDYGGRILSRKVEIERDFQFNVGDVVKLERAVLQIKSMKTITSRIRKGGTPAEQIKRVYGRPADKRDRFQYDLTSKIVETAEIVDEDED
nr:HVO_0476 family zinc finger protein [uncultured Methanobacterium sp.]